VAALVAAAALLCAAEASAQCVQTGSDVSCTGTDPDGFVAAESDLTVSVQPNASVENGGSGTALQVISSTQITIEQDGSVVATGESAFGIAGTGLNTLTNRGSVIVSGAGAGAAGIGLGTNSSFVNEATGRLAVSPGVTGANAFGVNGGTGASITNHGRIDVGGTSAFGVAGGTNGSVTNTGSIITTGTGSAATSMGSFTTLDNSGTIEATGDGGVGIRIAGAQDRVTNSGDIRGGSGTGAGVLFDSGAGQGSFVNEAGGLVEAIGNDGVGIRFTGFQNTATNRGTIRGGDGEGAGVSFGTATNQGSFVNDAGGLVEALSGIAIQGSAGIDQVSNAGTIAGDVLLDSGNDTFSWAPGSIVNGVLDGGDGNDRVELFQPNPAAGVDGVFDLGTSSGFENLAIGRAGDTGTWTIIGNGSWERIDVVDGIAQFGAGNTITNPVTVQGGTARLGDGTSYTREISVAGGTALLENGATTTADVRVAAGGTVASEQSSSLAGTLTFEALSSYRSTFDPASATRVDVQGTIEIEANAELSLVRANAAPIVRNYRVLTASNGITGQFAGMTGSAFQRATQTYGPASGASFLDVLIESSFSLPATTANENRVGQHLNEAAFLGPSAAFSDFLATLGTITDPEEASDALDALHPEVYDAHTSASFETGSTFSALLAARPLRCEQFVSPYQTGRPSLEPCSRKGLTPWVTGFGRYADRDGAPNFRNWSYYGGGLAFGVDHDLSPDVLLSAMLGSSRLGLDFDGDGDGSLTTFEMGLAGAWRRGDTHVRGVIEYGHGWHETHRQVDFEGFSRLALSDHESNRVTALLEAGHTFVMMPFEIEPIASLEYTYLHEESTKESNAGVVDLDLGSRSNSVIATRSGFRAAMTLVKYAYAGALLEWADGVWRPEIRASWRQVWNDYDRNVSARLDGAPARTPEFRTRSQDAQYGADLGARIGFQPFGTANTIDLSYGAFIGDRTAVHTLMARFRMPL
jgi:subtilase-type serine protease